MSLLSAELAPGQAGSSTTSFGLSFTPGAAAVAGARGDAWLRVDGQEHARRGGTCVVDLLLLDVLSRLPVGRPVPLDLLTPRDRDAVSAAPGLAVRVGGGCVTRLLRPPVEVVLVTCGGGWRPALRRAARFRHFAPSAVLLDRLPRRWPEAAWEADLAGVGVLVGDGPDAEVVIPATAPQSTRKAAHWRFEERAYGRWSVTC